MLKLKLQFWIFMPKTIIKALFGYDDDAEVLKVHVRDVGHVGAGALLSVGVDPDEHEIFYDF